MTFIYLQTSKVIRIRIGIKIIADYIRVKQYSTMIDIDCITPMFIRKKERESEGPNICRCRRVLTCLISRYCLYFDVVGLVR